MSNRDFQCGSCTKKNLKSLRSKNIGLELESLEFGMCYVNTHVVAAGPGFRSSWRSYVRKMLLLDFNIIAA